MPNKKAKVIPEPKSGTRAILAPKTLPAIIGKGDINVLCGSCRSILIKTMSPNQINNMVVKCPCGKFNDI